MATTAKKETVTVMLPEGRLINHSLFERDAYTPENGKPGEPKYKVELAFDPKDVTGEGTVEDKLADAIADKWGEAAADAFLAGKRGFVNPLIDGDMLAEKRAEKGKEGQAYKGKLVIRADSKFNKDGVEGPGGMAVYGPDTTPMNATNQGDVYPGCYGIAAVTISTYLAQNGDKGVKCYLKAFQVTRDGEKLTKAADTSSLFKPVGKQPEAEGGRRRRAG